MQKKFFVFSRPVEKFYKLSGLVNVFSKRLDGSYIEMNDCVVEMMKASSSSSLIGKNDFDHFPFEIARELRKNDELVQSTDKSRFLIESGLFENGYIRKSFLSLKTPLRDSCNHIVGTFGIAYYLERTPLSEIMENINNINIILSDPLLSYRFDAVCRHYSLSSREKECLYLIIKGMTAKEIGNILYIASKTVGSHIEKIKSKFNCRKRSEIVAKVFDFELY